MEIGEAIEDKFAKVHPRFETNTRIGIIGGGPSGLSAAYALCKLGYSNVTVLEKHHSVGGMCESIDIEGKFLDLFLFNTNTLKSYLSLVCKYIQLYNNHYYMY
ncbi:putative dihydropyrimidine dehydrogenase (NADP(+)) [Helianthus debilis subsp. tardiflorus]